MKKFEKSFFLKVLTYFDLNSLIKFFLRNKSFIVEGEKQFLIDISVYHQNDAGTGIQRVVRTIKKIIELDIINNSYSTDKFTIKFIYATRKKSYRYVDNHQEISVKAGDIFFGLDWSAHILTANFNEIIKMKNSGIFFSFILYDMLPATNEEWFTKETAQKHKIWLKLVSIIADQILCISDDVNHLLLMHYSKQGFNYNHIDISTIPLGSDFDSYPKENTSQEYTYSKLINQHFALVVGTLEPRKGHLDVLKVFHQLWQDDFGLKLIFVGRPGWKNNEILKLIEKTQILFPNSFELLESLEDEQLKTIYENADIVICPSRGEGYGLPVIEAMYFNKKIIARDIPVFREISKNQINFFNSHDELKNNLITLSESSKIKYDYKIILWRDATNTIIKKIYVAASEKWIKLNALKLDHEA